MTIGTGLPTTQTELFKCFIINVLLRHLVAKQGHNPSRLRLRKFSSLPEKERQVFDQLCRIAHRATFNTRSSSRSNQLLSLDDLEEEGVNDLQETMGLMKVHTRLTCYGYDPYYGFLHSSVQDFLCAVRMSQLNPEEQMRDFQKIMSIDPMSLVLLFYAGMTKLDNSSVCKYLHRIGMKPPQFDTIIPNICDCCDTLSEAGDNRRLFLAYLHCLYEADRSDLLVTPLPDFGSSTDSHTGFSFFFYRLSMYNINVVFHSLVDIARFCQIELSLCCCDLNDRKVESAVEILINRASLNYRKLKHCVAIGIQVCGNNLTYNSVKSLARLIAAEGINLYCLDISGNFLTRQSSTFEVLKILTESMSSAQCFFLRMLVMDGCGFTSRHAYHLILLLRQNIKHLKINDNDLCECVSMLVAAVRQTKYLDLRSTFVTDKELIQVGRILQSNTCLEQLLIGFVNEPFQPQFFSPEAVCEFIKLITSHTSQSKLSFLSIPDCHMNTVDSNEQVQIALKNFCFRRCYPLEIGKFSVPHETMTAWRNHSDRVNQLSIPDSLLYGTK